jgi:hypothetical protein
VTCLRRCPRGACERCQDGKVEMRERSWIERERRRRKRDAAERKTRAKQRARAASANAAPARHLRLRASQAAQHAALNAAELKWQEQLREDWAEKGVSEAAVGEPIWSAPGDCGRKHLSHSAACACANVRREQVERDAWERRQVRSGLTLTPPQAVSPAAVSFPARPPAATPPAPTQLARPGPTRTSTPGPVPPQTSARSEAAPRPMQSPVRSAWFEAVPRPMPATSSAPS